MAAKMRVIETDKDKKGAKETDKDARVPYQMALKMGMTQRLKNQKRGPK